MSAVAETATVAHGYTMADLDRIAWRAVRKNRSGALDPEDKHYAAWHGVIDELFATNDAPTPYELLVAGLKALDRAVQSEARHHGSPTFDGQDWHNAPRFSQYWLPVRQPQSDGFTDRLVEVVALPAALSVLSAEQYEAIVTLAAFDNDMQAAADAIGMKYHGAYYRVQSARKLIKEVWFEGETPAGSKPTSSDETGTCRSGHSRAEHGVRQPSGVWLCRMCARNFQRRSAARSR